MCHVKLLWALSFSCHMLLSKPATSIETRQVETVIGSQQIEPNSSHLGDATGEMQMGALLREKVRQGIFNNDDACHWQTRRSRSSHMLAFVCSIVWISLSPSCSLPELSVDAYKPYKNL